MPLFTTDRVDQLFERLMKHHVSPTGSVGAGVHRTPAPKPQN